MWAYWNPVQFSQGWPSGDRHLEEPDALEVETALSSQGLAHRLRAGGGE